MNDKPTVDKPSRLTRREQPPEDPAEERRRELFEARLRAGPLGNAWTRSESTHGMTLADPETRVCAYYAGLRHGLLGRRSCEQFEHLTVAPAYALGWSVGTAQYEAGVRRAAEGKK